MKFNITRLEFGPLAVNEWGFLSSNSNLLKQTPNAQRSSFWGMQEENVTKVIPCKHAYQR
jgi:hypothetical protein